MLTQEQPREVTQLLLAWNDGDESALEKLVPLVYHELRHLAQRRMRLERPDHTLQTTALINEAYLRLVDVHNVHWQNRAHFFALCARLMRRILVDYARTRHYAKRGGGAQAISLDQSLPVAAGRSPDLVAVDEALHALAGVDARKAQVVELRFFGGLTVEETAEVLKVSPETVRRDWRLAKVWLLRELSGVRQDA
ncbi:MAG TPA: sigma-70 family RNA polymerase sigma factor [Terriglobales bacterium]|jgi:RNA polymerase sigma factor (TIGR02999 family)|nr:sigma-70 family RNA polymerase sigma factor [Terriglobales bacterium]